MRAMSQPEAVWYTRCPVPTPLGLAVQLGFIDEAFARVGVSRRSIADAPDRAVRESHFTHSLEWSFRQGGNVPPIAARASGRKTRLAGITWTDEFQALVTLPDSPIASASDLAGQRFGLPKRPGDIVDFHRATALKGLVSALSLKGLRLDDVQTVDVAIGESVLDGASESRLFGLKRRLPYSHEIAALLQGEVDAVFVKGTQGVTAANLFGLKTIAEFGFHPDPRVRINSGTPRVLTVDARLADERPDLAAILVAQVRRASAWAEEHPDETRRFVAWEAGASEETVLAANGPDLHLHLGLDLTPDLLDAVAHYKDFLLRHGFIANDFNVRAWADLRPLGASDLSKAA